MAGTFRKWRLLGVLAALLALTVAGCGGDDSSSSADSPGPGNPVDRAFVAEMIPHHELAIEMAELAKKDGQHPELKALAGRIITAQTAEIAQLKSLDAKLAKAGIEKGDLGVSESHSGMDMKMSELEGADPFDRTFIDMMVVHHEGAITMAKAELAKGKNAALRDIAEQIIADQQSEVDQMRDWRKAWYGAAMDDSMDMDH